MATTRITDVIDPEILSDLIMDTVADNLFMLPGISNLPKFDVPTKGTLWTIPYADILGDLESFIPGTPLTIQNMTQDVFRHVVVRKAGLYGADKVVKLAAIENPMDYFQAQFSELLLKTLMETQVYILDGAIPSANINDQSNVSVSETLIFATKQKLGDQASDLKWIIMHSSIYATLQTAGKITWMKKNQVLPVLAGANNSQVIEAGESMVPTIAGMIIGLTDKCPFSSPDYDTFLLGDRVMGLFYQQLVNIDLDYDISLKENYISPDFDFVMPLYGVDYTSTSYTTGNLSNTANYTLKWDQKNVKAAKLICKP